MSQQREESTAVRAPAKLPEQPGQRACLIVLSGQAVGRLFKLSDTQCIIGRSDVVEVSLDDDGVSRRHASIAHYDDCHILQDLESTNGTFVNGEPIRTRALVNGDRIQIGASTILKFAIHDAIEEQFQHQLFSAATRDVLTQTYNRRHFDDQLSRDWSYAKRHEAPLSLALIDLDHFKRINDTRGHPAGDAVLQQFATKVLALVRNEDFLCRLGGDEFALVMRGTSLEGASNVCARLRSMVEQSNFDYHGHAIKVTVSIGIAAYANARHNTIEDLIKEADAQLYAAKGAGRNRIAHASIETPEPKSG